jgi:hypothetical protein
MNSLKIYNVARNERILHKVVQCLSHITSKFRNTAIFKSSVRENNDSNKFVGMFMIFQCTKLHLSKRTVHELFIK